LGRTYKWRPAGYRLVSLVFEYIKNHNIGGSYDIPLATRFSYTGGDLEMKEDILA
jgi:hypothetical protein